MNRRHRPPYWALVAFAALLVAPPWATAAIAGVALGVGVLRAGWFLAGRARPRAMPEDAIVLGTGLAGGRRWITERDLGSHGLIVGASGAGKTTSLLTILGQLIKRGRPVIVIDMKGSPSFARALEQAAVTAGRPFKLWTPDGPGRWNPLQYGNPTELKDKLIGSERFTEPHYQRAAERFVLNVLQVLDQAHPERRPTLAEVVRLMDPRRLAVSLRDVPQTLAERVQDYLAGLTPDQVSAIRGLQTRLAIVTESHTGRYLEPERAAADDTIDVRRALSGPEVVLFSLNTSIYGKLAAQLGTLAVQDLICATGQRLQGRALGSQRDLAVVAIDESSVLGDQLITLFARGREAGVGALAVTQELVDFDRISHGLRDQVLGNTALKLAHRQEVPSSAQTIAEIAGTEKAWDMTEQVGGSLVSGYSNGRGTRREVERFVVHPNEIKALRTGEAVLISKLRGERAQVVRVMPAERGPSVSRAAPARAADRPLERDAPGLS